ncbi:MAG: hypothetical protein AAGC88_13705 [Bacteroidota bacterium]
MKRINLLIALAALMGFVIVSCDSQEDLLSPDLSDAALIDAIAAADRSEVAVTELPDASQSALTTEFDTEVVAVAEVAPDLGFQVGLVSAEGEDMGAISNEFFDLNGRRLSREGGFRARGLERRGHRGDKGKCFQIVFPYNLTLPDGTTVTIESREDMRSVFEWYRENEGVEERPTIEFPIELEYAEDSIVAIASQEELEAAYENCQVERRGNRERCFEFVLPVTFTMADGSEITVTVEEDFELIRDWKEANPDLEGRPEVNFPVDVTLADESVVTVASQEELEAILSECRPDGGQGEG